MVAPTTLGIGAGSEPALQSEISRLAANMNNAPGGGKTSLKNSSAQVNVKIKGLSQPEQHGETKKKDKADTADDYAKCLLFPYENAVRVPTAYSNKSSLLRSRRTFVIDSNALGSSGNFAFFVQPKLGDPSSPDRFQVGLLKSPSEDTDLSNPASYIDVDTSGSSLSMDPNARWITQGTQGLIAIRNGDGVVDPNSPLSNYAQIRNGNRALDFALQYEVLPPPMGEGGNIIRIPPGAYLVSFALSSAGSSVNAPYALRVLNSDRVTFADATNVYIIGDFTDSSIAWLVRVNPGQSLWLAPVVQPTSVDNWRMAIAPSCSPAQAWSMEYGLTEAIRPVGLSVLTTNLLPDMTAGGLIESALLSELAMDKVMNPSQWLTPTGLASLGEHYRGNLKRGNYTWWRPFQVDELKFRSIDEHNKFEYPLILVRGNVPKPSDLMAGQGIVAVTVEFVYEIMQNTQMLERKSSFGTTQKLEEALGLLSKVGSSTSNDSHGNLLKKVNHAVDTGVKLAPMLTALGETFGWI